MVVVREVLEREPFGDLRVGHVGLCDEFRRRLVVLLLLPVNRDLRSGNVTATFSHEILRVRVRRLERGVVCGEAATLSRRHILWRKSPGEERGKNAVVLGSTVG